MNPRARVSGWMGCMASASLVLPQRGCKTLRYIPPSTLCDTALQCPRLRPHCRSEKKDGSGAWTRTRITRSKVWCAANCTTPEQLKTKQLAVCECGEQVEFSLS